MDKPLDQKKRWNGSWPANCDTCMDKFGITTDLSAHCRYFIDGKTKNGPWALMCPECHKDFGVGLGTGLGQKYDSKTLVKLEG